MNVHPEIGEHAGYVRKKKRLVQRDDRQIPDVVVPLEEGVDFVLLDAAREPYVAVDRRQAEERQVSARQAFEEVRELRFGDILRTAGDDHRKPRRVLLQQVVSVAERQAVVGVNVKAPEKL